MANDLFGGLGGLVKGLSGFMPQDDPNVKIMNAQTQVSELQEQEAQIYIEIGRKTVAQQGLDAFPEYSDKLRLIQSNLVEAQSQLQTAQQEKQQVDEAAKADQCPSCGLTNPEGTNFCQSCGSKLGAIVCVSCGASLEPGTHFCGSCGTSQGGV